MTGSRLTTTALLMLLLAPQIGVGADLRVRGELGARTYGYQDAAGEDHLWLLQSSRLSLASPDGGFAFHFSGLYIGDGADDYSRSGQARLYRAYLQSEGPADTRLRLGRFFVAEGVAVGVVDGASLQRRFGRSFDVSAFAGTPGPLSREFATDADDGDFSAGGRLRWTTAVLPLLGRSSFAISYARQTRHGRLLRDRYGLQTSHRPAPGRTWLNSIELRSGGSPLRRLVSRLRCDESTWNGMLEAAVYSPDVADDSWFAGFGELPTALRVRFNLYRHLNLRRWGVGLDGALLSQTETGFRLGPALRSPIGSAGYAFSFGDRSNTSGPWAYFNYRPAPGLTLYMSGSHTTYEWEAVDLKSDELSAFNGGVRWSPGFAPGMTVNTEFQVYGTPQLSEDRRALAGVSWRFDNRGAVR